MEETVLAKDRSSHFHVPLDKVVGVDTRATPAATVTCTPAVLMGTSTACPRSPVF